MTATHSTDWADSTGRGKTIRKRIISGFSRSITDFVNSQDVLRTYRFRFNNPTQEISAEPTKPIIERKFKVRDILQRLEDANQGGKKPMAMMEMTARTTKDELDDSKAWAFNNPVVEGGEVFTNQVGLANQSHDLRLIEMTGWSSFPTIDRFPWRKGTLARTRPPSRSERTVQPEFHLGRCLAGGAFLTP